MKTTMTSNQTAGHIGPEWLSNAGRNVTADETIEAWICRAEKAFLRRLKRRHIEQQKRQQQRQRIEHMTWLEYPAGPTQTENGTDDIPF